MAGDKTGIGDGGKSNDDGDKVGGQATASRAMARATVTRWRGPPPRRQRSKSGAVGSIVAGATSDVGGTTARSLSRRSVKVGIGNKSSPNPFSRM